MATREIERRKRQKEDNRFNQFCRGVDKFAPSGVESGYDDVYPMVSRRGKIMYGGKSSFELRRSEAQS